MAIFVKREDWFPGYPMFLSCARSVACKGVKSMGVSSDGERMNRKGNSGLKKQFCSFL